MDNNSIVISGAREHNLKNIDLVLPRKKFIVITGISGSGKSSLAFDTIYAEGQRRYMESFSAYARSFIGNMERPDVDKIEGLSPVISIEQKTTSRNPRSTVGTVTELYDFLRLLFARVGNAYSYITGEKMIKQSEDQIIDQVLTNFKDKKIMLLAPLIKGRKGHYRELFVQVRKLGFSTVRVDGNMMEMQSKMQVDRYKTHDIEVVVDRIKVEEKSITRIRQSVKTALKQGNGMMMIMSASDKPVFFSKNLMDPKSGLSYDDPSPNKFSFNSPYGACPTCKGLGSIEQITKKSIFPNTHLNIAEGAIAPLGEYRDIWIFKKLQSILKKYKYELKTPIKDMSEEVIGILLYGDKEPIPVRSIKYLERDWNIKFEGIIPFLEKSQASGSEKIRAWLKEYMDIRICEDCNGNRLTKEALSYKIGTKNIAQLATMQLDDFGKWIDQIPDLLTERQNLIAKEIIKELKKRLGFLIQIGLDYLNLNRPLKTLSGGESQRIRLATQIGTQLVNVLYILDEPSIGLHQRDNIKLIESLKSLRDLGNTVIVVEHDKDMMLASDFIVDIGPGAGKHGGQVVAQGPPKQFLEQECATAKYIAGKNKIHKVSSQRKLDTTQWLELKGASGHNLQNIDIKIPLKNLILITGVSGSGKSTLVHQTLYPALKKLIYKSKSNPLAYEKLLGYKYLDKIIEVDQSPIGRTPRSNPVTYTNIFTDIRILFSELPEAKIRGYQPRRFSFNVKGGRCETCKGGGMQLITMDFLPDVYVQCDTCKRKRYNRETLDVRYKGKSIADVLDMTISQSIVFFKHHPKIHDKLKVLEDVGLGYLSLGQHATTLSGGEAQRVKLSAELSKRDTGKTLYILDEPTTGLHFQDIEHLLRLLLRLRDKGNTVLIIEHNPDVIKMADYIIDLGPEGGKGGGNLVAQGTPEEVMRVENNHTAKFLRAEMTNT